MTDPSNTPQNAPSGLGVAIAVLVSCIPVVLLAASLWAISQSTYLSCVGGSYDRRAPSDATAGFVSATGCTMDTEMVDTVVAPMPQHFELLWVPEAAVACLAGPPWLLWAWRKAVGGRRRGYGCLHRAWLGPLVAVAVSLLVAVAALTLWPAQFRVASNACVTGSYTTSGAAGKVTERGCTIPTDGAAQITVPTPSQFRLLQLSGILAAALAVPPWVLVARDQRLRSRGTVGNRGRAAG